MQQLIIKLEDTLYELQNENIQPGNKEHIFNDMIKTNVLINQIITELQKE